MWRRRGELRDSYDVVIIGGGAHGLATAYYLREHGITNVAVLEKSYIGSGAAGRNTTILRSNYKTPEGARFYDASVKLYEGLSAGARLQPAVLPVRPSDARPLRPGDVRDGQPRRGQPPARHRFAPRRPRRRSSDSPPAMNVSRGRDLSDPGRRSITRRGGIIRHDAVVWGFARGADAGGAEIHPYTEVPASSTSTAASPACRPTAGASPPPPWSTPPRAGARSLCDMAGVALPITTHILQACVTEPVKPLLDVVSSPRRCTSTSARPTAASS